MNSPIELDEAIALYARWMRAWFGARAGSEARKKADAARGRGDSDGEGVWLRVQTEITGANAEAAR